MAVQTNMRVCAGARIMHARRLSLPHCISLLRIRSAHAGHVWIDKKQVYLGESLKSKGAAPGFALFVEHPSGAPFAPE